MKRLVWLLALLAVCPASVAYADVPSTMSYQGVLTDAGGNLVSDGNYNLTFRIYDVSVGGVALYTENHPSVPVQLGGFSVIIGSTTPIGLPFDDPYWLGIQVGADPELSPRIPLASSPYGLSLRLPASAVFGSEVGIPGYARRGGVNGNGGNVSGNGTNVLYRTAGQAIVGISGNGTTRCATASGASAACVSWTSNSRIRKKCFPTGSSSDARRRTPRWARSRSSSRCPKR